MTKARKEAAAKLLRLYALKPERISRDGGATCEVCTTPIEVGARYRGETKAHRAHEVCLWRKRQERDS